jgi:hypothetical protein
MRPTPGSSTPAGELKHAVKGATASAVTFADRMPTAENLQ